jgi:hypothetical protein
MFGSTNCGKCEGSSFKVQEISPAGSAYKMISIQCSACQTPIGIADYFNTGTLLTKQAKQIEDIEKKLSSIQNSVSQIAHALNSMAR